MIETSWLRALAAFAQDPNLSRTAHLLHLTQPAVHAQLRKLSEALGAPLYRREGRGLVLTAEGVEAAAFARDFEERARELRARVGGGARQDHVVLAAGTGALLYVVGPGLKAFTKRHGGRLEVLSADGAASVDAVRSGLAHVGVAALDLPPAGLEVQPLSTVEQVLVTPRDHRLAKRRRVAIADLAGERLVLPPRGRPHRAMIEAALAAARTKVVEGATARGWELTIKLVELGMGLAIVNGCCHVPRTLACRRLLQLPPVSYVAFRRPDGRPSSTALLRTLVEHGDDWRGAT